MDLNELPRFAAFTDDELTAIATWGLCSLETWWPTNATEWEPLLTELQCEVIRRQIEVPA